MGFFGKSPAEKTHERISRSFTLDGLREALLALSLEDKAKMTVEEFLNQQSISVDDFKKIKDQEAVIPRVIQKMLKLDKPDRTMTIAQFIDQLPADLREAL